jgi:virginiamycin B lyase
VSIAAPARQWFGTWLRRGRFWSTAVASLALVALVALLAWRYGPWADPGFVEWRMPQATDVPVAVAAGPDGVVWFTLDSSNAIGRLKHGRIEKVRKPTENLEPLGLAAGAHGSVWYTDAHARAISRVTHDGTITSYDLSTPVARLGRLALAPDGAAWFAEPTAVSVTRLKDGVLTRHPVGPLTGAGDANVGPFGVAVDAQGTVWATLQNANKLLRLSPRGEMTEFTLPTRHSGPGDVAIDATGAVWILELSANKVARFAAGRFEEFSVPTPNAGLTALAVAPDGSAWFTEMRAHKLGRVHGGVVKELPLPRRDARPFGVSVDATNNVWYTDLTGWLGMLPADRARGN